jgi:hypothetical protein
MNMSIKCKDDFVGKKFGRLSVISFLPDNTKYSSFLCVCECGKEKITHSFQLKKGTTKSCGCLKKDSDNRGKKHGLSGKKRDRTYNSWASMMDRCVWGGHKVMYSKYGAKGITVCERWHNFKNFLEDMGARPADTSIDRIDGTKGYYKDNCRWATRQQQNANTSRSHRVIYQGKTIAIVDLARNLNIPLDALRSRAFRRGKDYVKALGTYGIKCDPWSSFA